MKLAAIYNLWDGEELLQGSMNLIKDFVDTYIIVWQDVSNFGEKYNPLDNLDLSGYNVVLEKYNPNLVNGFQNEINKRQIGLEIAKKTGHTHFLHLDCDEYYADFGAAKEEYERLGFNGSVCRMWTYFKDPTYRLETPEGYFVPFIHKLNPDTITGCKKYPFYVDPTRRINEKEVVELDVFMHHFSWVRKDIERKARNSSAKSNLEKGTLLKDYYCQNLVTNPQGYYLKDFDKRIILVENQFNL